MKTLKIACTGAATLPMDSIEPFQGSLKELSKANHAKLKKAIIDYGFSFPLFIWRNNGHFWTLDGHQRIQTLALMEKEGWTIPPLPVVWVDALDEREAKTKLLHAVGQYGKVNEDGLNEYINLAGLNMEILGETLELPGIDFDKFVEGFGPEKSPEDVPDPQVELAAELVKKYGVVDGAIFELGNHLIGCGDSTSAENISKLSRGGGEIQYMLDGPALECWVRVQFASEVQRPPDSQRQSGKKFLIIRGEILHRDKK